MSSGQREKRKDEWVETAESLGFCLNNQILLFMWSKLLRSATGHVEKLNDCKEDGDKLMDFCEGAWKHSEGSCVDACACCLLGDVRDIMMCRGCFPVYGFVLVRVTERWWEYVVDLSYFVFYKWKLPQYAWDTENETFEQIVALCVVNGHLWRYVLTSLNILSWQKHLLLCFTTNVPFESWK